MNNRKFLYLPSFHTGALITNARNETMLGEIGAKFWSDSFPEKFRYPYFLLSAGHAFKRLNERTRLDMDNTFVMGDSGGFQIATGQLSLDSKGEIRKQIFEWLEANSDVAMNLDIPPRDSGAGLFDECLDVSIKNFKFFEDNQSGKTKFLNVIHGFTHETYKKWYEQVKHFNFSGYSIGGATASFTRMLHSLVVLLESGEHLRKENEFLHFLGASTPMHFLALSQMQKTLNEVGSNMWVTIDSSSPNMQSRFGDYSATYNFKTLKSTNFHIRREPDNIEHLKGYPLPVLCEYDKWLNENTDFYQMSQFKSNQYNGMVQHNLFLLLEMKKDSDYYVNGDDYILGQIIDRDAFKLLKITEQLIKNPKDSFVILERNLPFLKKFDKKAERIESGKKPEITTSKFFK